MSKCSDCGGNMMVAVRENGNILYECDTCGNISLEHVYTQEEETNDA